MGRSEVRLRALRRRIEEAGADAFFSLAPPDNQYLTGFTGSTSGVIVTRKEALFLCDFRYTEQSRRQVAGFTFEEVSGSFAKSVGERLKALGVSGAAYDPACLTVAELNGVKSRFRGKLQAVPDLVGALRIVKSPGEIARIRRAAQWRKKCLKTS